MCLEILSNWQGTSPGTIYYNCFAWAAGESRENEWWDPISSDSYWPIGVERQRTLSAYVKAYQTIGYQLCDSSCFEKGFEKIALYVDNSGKPQHATRQLTNGMWTSKIGTWEDIQHSISEEFVIEIRAQIINFGTIAAVMKRLTG